METRTIIKQREDYFTNLVLELKVGLKEILGISYGDFKRVLAQIEDLITPHQILIEHRVILVTKILIVTLRFLVTGESFKLYSFWFRMSDIPISHIVQEVCCTTIKVLVPRFLKSPSSEKEWKSVAVEFQQVWNFPQSLVAIDDKYILIKQPQNGGLYNYD